MNANTEAIFKYLKQTNRPYSVNDIIQNLHKKYNKTVVQNALDELVKADHVMSKTYGKQVIYCIKQSGKNAEKKDASVVKEELKTKERELTEKQALLKKLQDENKQIKAKIKNLTQNLTTEEALVMKTKLVQEVTEKKTKLENLSNNVEVVSEADKKKLQETKEKLVKEYRKRKRMCTEMLDAVLENYPKSKKILLEETGVETDEMVKMETIV
uniref:Homologous-pairing protein 2 homolog n=1 Tax=Cacopsylla melanoneura TaxID=428564 RepID=A0A8D8Z4Z4_9HEMI